MRRLATAVAAAAVAVALGAPAGASASTLGISSGALSITGAPAEANHVTVWFDNTYFVYVIEDTGSTLSVPGKQQGCHAYTMQIAYCDYSAVRSVTIRLGNGGSFAQSKLTLTPVTIYAGSGNDTLIGGGGNNTLVGGAGTDTLTAGSGNTTMIAGSGNTTMTGGSGHDRYQGGAGADTINARNGVAEDVTCGGGADAVTADADDTASADCESVDRGDAGQPATDGAAAPAPTAESDTPLAGLGTPAPAPIAAIAPAPAAVAQASRVRVPVSCSAGVAAGCDGQLELSLPSASAKPRQVAAARRVKRVLGRSRRFHVAAGHKAIVPVRLSRRGVRRFRRSLNGRKSMKVNVTVAMRSEAGTSKETRTITVRLARRRPTSKGNKRTR